MQSETENLFVKLVDGMPFNLLEDSLCLQLLKNVSVDTIPEFWTVLGVLWTSDKPSFIDILERPITILLGFTSKNTQELEWARSWLKDYGIRAQDNEVLLKIVLRLFNQSSIKISNDNDNPYSLEMFSIVAEEYTLLAHALQVWINLLEFTDLSILESLSHLEPPPLFWAEKMQNSGDTYIVLLAKICLAVLSNEESSELPAEYLAKSHAAKLLKMLSDHLERSQLTQPLSLLEATLILLDKPKSNAVSSSRREIILLSILTSLLTPKKWYRLIASDIEQKQELSRPLSDHSQSINLSLVMKLFKERIARSSDQVLNAYISLLLESIEPLSKTFLNYLLPLTSAVTNEIEEKSSLISESLLQIPYTLQTLPLDRLSMLCHAIKEILIKAHGIASVERSAVVNKDKSSGDGTFLDNVMSGVFTVETPESRSSSANDRFTVVLCLQDAMRAMYTVWDLACNLESTRDGISCQMIALDLKTLCTDLYSQFARFHLQECVETLVQCYLTSNSKNAISFVSSSTAVTSVDLTKVITGSVTMRVNKQFSEHEYLSSTISVDPSTFISFLHDFYFKLTLEVVYTNLTPVIAFLRDVTMNLPKYYPLYSSLLQFYCFLCSKVSQNDSKDIRKPRKELLVRH